MQKKLNPIWLSTYSPLFPPSIIRSVRDNVAKVLKDKRVKVYPDSVYKIFLPFKLTPIHSVNVVLIGYEPYPYSGYSTGLAFANPVGMPKYSPTLEAIKECVYRDYYQENYFDMPFGDPYEYQFDYSLKSWANQGVLLLNRNLTVEHYKPNSHAYIWKDFTIELVHNLSNYNPNLIFVLIGREAIELKEHIHVHSTNIIECEHPLQSINKNRPWGGNTFKSINNKLNNLNMEEIQWLRK